MKIFNRRATRVRTQKKRCTDGSSQRGGVFRIVLQPKTFWDLQTCCSSYSKTIIPVRSVLNQTVSCCLINLLKIFQLDSFEISCVSCVKTNPVAERKQQTPMLKFSSAQCKLPQGLPQGALCCKVKTDW